MLIKHPTIPEEFFLGFFIEGLKEEIRQTVKMLDPYSLSHAVEKSRHKEELMESMSRKNKGYGGRQSTQSSTHANTTLSRPPSYIQKENGPQTSISGTKQFEARKVRGECYKCGERCFPGHVCKSKQLNILSGTTEQLEIVDQLENEIGSDENPEAIIDEAISLNALSRTVTSTTIKLKGVFGKQVLIILADSGNTRSLIPSSTAKQFGCAIQEDVPMRVAVANGGHLMSYHSCPQFKWKTQGIEFEHKLRPLDIGGCDVM